MFLFLPAPFSLNLSSHSPTTLSFPPSSSLFAISAMLFVTPPVTLACYPLHHLPSLWQPTGSGCPRQPLQPPHRQPRLWATIGETAERLPASKSQQLSLPPLPVSRKEALRINTPARETESKADPDGHTRTQDKRLGKVIPLSLPLVGPLGHRAVPDAVKAMARGGGWSWTVGESRHTAQWVKQKQEYRSTRPW